VFVPGYRSDIITQEDLLEELLKVYGYNKIIGKLPDGLELVSLVVQNDNFEKRKREIRTYLSACG